MVLSWERTVENSLRLVWLVVHMVVATKHLTQWNSKQAEDNQKQSVVLSWEQMVENSLRLVWFVVHMVVATKHLTQHQHSGPHQTDH